MVVSTTVLTAGCQDTLRPDAQAQSCADEVTVQGLEAIDRYEDRQWIGVGFVGAGPVDPMERVTVASGRVLELAPADDIPNGPYEVVAQGRVTGGDRNCRMNVKKLKSGLEPPAYLRIPESRVPAIVSGQDEVIVLVVGPGPE
ncbi:hypothetical protein [Micromonospora sp. CPCC 205714]|uniref:hypothetical protein n=1 Tax=Micromonospora sp. CPCC 205714 TaxID=3122402 RepID=UPI002FEF660A